jgi:hypothetical protein
MQNITDYKNQHHGKNIFVLASGPSLAILKKTATLNGGK